MCVVCVFFVLEGFLAPTYPPPPPKGTSLLQKL
jgi:hypothetical protein